MRPTYVSIGRFVSTATLVFTLGVGGALMAPPTTAQPAADAEAWPDAPKPKPKPKPKTDTPTTPKPKPEPKPKPPAENVNIELLMLADVSSSVDDNEFALQLGGYIDAFLDPEIHKLIESQDGVAVAFLQWSSTNQRAGSGWRILRTADDCVNYANRVLRAQVRKYNHNTVMAPHLQSGVWYLNNNNINSFRKVIDVSGDGICENYLATMDGTYDNKYGNRDWNRTYDLLRDNNIVVNAISIGDTAGLAQWYADTLPTGDGSFAMHAEDFEAFGDAIKQKLLKELDPTFLNALYD